MASSVPSGGSNDQYVVDPQDKNDANDDGKVDIYKNKDYDPSKPSSPDGPKPGGDAGDGHTYREIHQPGANREEEQFNLPAPRGNI
jgi:hypothetical protein